MKSLVYLFLAFATTTSATSPVVDVCLLPFKITGPQCLDYLPRFHFNWQSGRCEAFIYGGCRGNANRFRSLQDCHERCKHLVVNKMVHVKSPSCVADSSEMMIIHPVGREPGSTRFTFNLDTLSCERRLYEGCKPRPNVFKTWEDCRSTCIYGDPDALTEMPVSKSFGRSKQLESGAAGHRMLSSICYLPPVDPNGIDCRGYFLMWTYNSTLKRCVQYRGCSGTENLFNTVYECRKACPGPNMLGTSTPDLCRLPKVVGPCRRISLRFAFNPKHNRCEYFLYGGCLGNQNNFRTADECLDVCGGTEPSKNIACILATCNRVEPAPSKAKGCTPSFSSPDECCPNSWNCPQDGICFYESTSFPEGKLYTHGELVSEANSECEHTCRCEAVPGSTPHVWCATQTSGAGCAIEFLMKTSRGCTPTYKSDDCCDIDWTCSAARNKFWRKPIVQLE